MKFQPYFVAYAQAHGRAPAAQLDFDSTRWPGGCMTGFILWIAKAKVSFRELHPAAFMPGGDVIHDFTAWGKFLESFPCEK